MGQNPTDSEVHDMINQVDVDGSGVVEFDEFCQFVDKLMKNIDPENEAREAYRRYKRLASFEKPTFIAEQIRLYLRPFISKAV